VRILSNPAYPTVDTTPREVVSRLRRLCSLAGHEAWSDSVSLLDEQLFRPEMVTSHHKITDIYLLGLAVRQRGTLASFDRHIPLKAVVGAQSSHLELLGARVKHRIEAPHFETILVIGEKAHGWLSALDLSSSSKPAPERNSTGSGSEALSRAADS
jgi:hypothetical protein